MTEIAKKYVEIGIIKDLCDNGILTEEEMKLAIIELNKDYEKRILKKKYILE